MESDIKNERDSGVMRVEISRDATEGVLRFKRGRTAGIEASWKGTTTVWDGMDE